MANRRAAEVDQNRDRTFFLQLTEARIRRRHTGVFDHQRTKVRHDARVLCGIGVRISAIGVDIKLDLGTNGRANVTHDRAIDIDALSAFDLDGLEAIARHHGRRFGRHVARRLTRECPGDINTAPPTPEVAKRSARSRRVKIPARVVDQRFGSQVLRNALERVAYRWRAGQVGCRDDWKKYILNGRDQAASGDAAPGRLHRDLGDPYGPCFVLQAKQNERGGLLDDITPLDRLFIA